MSKLEKNLIKNNLWMICIAVAVILLIVLLAVIYPTYKKSTELGSTGGALLGEASGKLMGSVDGVAKGLEKGAADGKAEAISAKDTEVKVIGRVQELGNLEVLSLNIKRSGINEADGGKTMVLWITECEAVFSVDLTKAQIISENDKCTVLIPYPELSTSFKDPEKKASYSKTKGTGSSEAGSAEYINSENEIRDKIKQELENDPDIRKMAGDAALSQVKQLISNVSVNDKQITVEFKEGMENGGE